MWLYNLVAPSDQSGRDLRPRSVLSTQQRDAERDPGALEDEEVDVVDRIDVQGDRYRAAECVAERGRRVASEAPRVFILGLYPDASRRAKLALSERTATKES
jgi:hypothetical protein